MKRRIFMAASAAGAATLALPSVGRAQSRRVLRFIPNADLAVLDPIWSTVYVTCNHGYLVFDTLYGQAGPEGGFAVSPQMVAGHTVEDDGRTWTLTLRDGLLFHDSEPVLARDCVASVRRWGARDALGQTLLERTGKLSAPDDRTIRFRLKRPFALLPQALGKAAPTMCRYPLPKGDGISADLRPFIAETDARARLLEQSRPMAVLDPDVLGGSEPVVRGMRVPVREVAAAVAAGLPLADIPASYPGR